MADLQIAEGSKYEALSGVQKEKKELKEVQFRTGFKATTVKKANPRKGTVATFSKVVIPNILRLL